MKRHTTHPVYDGKGMAVQRWAVGGAIPQIPWAAGVHPAERQGEVAIPLLSPPSRTGCLALCLPS